MLEDWASLVASRERQILDPVLHVGRIGGSCDEFQVADGLADRDVILVGIDQPSEFSPLFRPSPSENQEITILAEEDSTQR